MDSLTQRKRKIEIIPEIEGLLFPLQSNELELLEKSILEDGIRDPLVVWPYNDKDILLDGHHRFRLAQKYGLSFKTVEKHFKSLDEAKQWVLQNQLGRRNLTDEQRAYIQGKLYEMMKKAPKGFEDRDLSRAHFEHGDKSAATAKKIGSLFGSSQATVRRNYEFAKAVDRVREVKPEVAEKIFRGEVKDALTALPQVIKKEDPEVVREALERVARGESKKIKKAVMEVKIQKLKKKAENLKLPDGKYDVIVIDPPWPYGTSYDPETRRCASPYPEMSIEELKKLKIPAADDCILWLWTTNAFMHEAFHLLEAWGFEPKTILTWVKNRIGLGNWLRGQTEHCILAVKGRPRVNLTNQSTVLFAKVREHSRKPEEFYQLVDSLCYGRKLDYFGRGKREGWDVYGTGEFEK